MGVNNKIVTMVTKVRAWFNSNYPSEYHSNKAYTLARFIMHRQQYRVNIKRKIEMFKILNEISQTANASP